ncbi:hypothetical protein Csa_019502 [Cucumis sativus]|uniref:Uncharacterized protein n=1 Tax=Cucumis sativus TaxID=3659 RepID=A0A0A0LKP0_CUCSA|nr:hypothetical protein Csa_019502 [Cucumis sativus]
MEEVFASSLFCPLKFSKSQSFSSLSSAQSRSSSFFLQLAAREKHPLPFSIFSLTVTFPIPSKTEIVCDLGSYLKPEGRMVSPDLPYRQCVYR